MWKGGREEGESRRIGWERKGRRNRRVWSELQLPDPPMCMSQHDLRSYRIKLTELRSTRPRGAKCRAVPCGERRRSMGVKSSLAVATDTCGEPQCPTRRAISVNVTPFSTYERTVATHRAAHITQLVCHSMTQRQNSIGTLLTSV